MKPVATTAGEVGKLRQPKKDAEESKRAIEAEGHRALLLSGDVQDNDFCRNAVEKTVKEFGKVDILVNNTAFQQHQKSLEELSDEQWDRTFQNKYLCLFSYGKSGSATHEGRQCDRQHGINYGTRGEQAPPGLMARIPQ